MAFNAQRDARLEIETCTIFFSYLFCSGILRDLLLRRSDLNAEGTQGFPERTDFMLGEKDCTEQKNMAVKRQTTWLG